METKKQSAFKYNWLKPTFWIGIIFLLFFISEGKSYAHYLNAQPNKTKHKIILNFSGMELFSGVNLWLRVHEQETGTEIARVKTGIDTFFSVNVEGLESGIPYFVDFFIDHNQNGQCKVRGGTPIWRLSINNLRTDSIINFKYDTVFADIGWKYKLTFHFTEMSPHINQELTIFLIDIFDGSHIDTMHLKKIPAADFTLSSYKINWGDAYELDFFVDKNKNGMYDSPPVDHAWRYPLYSVFGDTTITFRNNTNFTDIKLATTFTEIMETKSSLVIFPNPTRQTITLLNPKKFQTKPTIKIVNYRGKELLFPTITSGVKSWKMDVSMLKSGVYFLQIHSGTTNEVLKFVKL